MKRKTVVYLGTGTPTSRWTPPDTTFRWATGMGKSTYTIQRDGLYLFHGPEGSAAHHEQHPTRKEIAMTVTSVLPLFSMDGEAPSATRVYFGLGACGERIKIGLTKRKSGHRGGEMWFIELCSVPGDRVDEDHYHAKYVTERIGKTEWFHLSDRLCMDLVAMCLGQQRTQSYEILKGVLYARLRQRKDAA